VVDGDEVGRRSDALPVAGHGGVQVLAVLDVAAGRRLEPELAVRGGLRGQGAPPS
jgi:hypothetical protein